MSDENASKLFTKSRKSRTSEGLSPNNRSGHTQHTASSIKKCRKKSCSTEREHYREGSNRSMMVIDKSGRHFYIPNNDFIEERNECLYIPNNIIKSPTFEESQTFYNRPQINKISKTLAREKLRYSLPGIGDVFFLAFTYEKSQKYEATIKNIGQILDYFIKSIDSEQKHLFNKDQLKEFLYKLTNYNDPEINVDNFSTLVWNLLIEQNAEKQEMQTDDIYNLMLIFLGTTKLDQGVTMELLSEFYKKTIKYEGEIPDFRQIVMQGKKLFENFNAQNNEGKNQYKTLLSSNFESPRDNESVSSVWNDDREKAMVERLSTAREPKFTVDIDKIKNREFEECTYHPKITNIPKSIYKTTSSGFNENLSEPAKKPKNYDQYVTRIRKINKEKQDRQDAEERKILESGDRLARLRKMKPNPPSCLTRAKSAPRKRPIMLYVDVTLSHGKYFFNKILSE